MKTIVLSDHVGERLRDAIPARETQYWWALASWQAETAACELERRAPRAACLHAWRERRWFTLLLACVQVRRNCPRPSRTNTSGQAVAKVSSAWPPGWARDCQASGR